MGLRAAGYVNFSQTNGTQEMEMNIMVGIYAYHNTDNIYKIERQKDTGGSSQWGPVMFSSLPCTKASSLEARNLYFGLQIFAWETHVMIYLLYI